MMAFPLLEKWLGLLEAESDEALTQDAWRGLTPPRLLSELAQALVSVAPADMAALWERLGQSGVRDYLDYLYAVPRSRRRGEPEDPRDIARLHGALRGMVSGAIVVRALLENRPAPVWRWLQISACDWQGGPFPAPALALSGEENSDPAGLTPAQKLARVSARLRAESGGTLAVGQARAWASELLAFCLARAASCAAAGANANANPNVSGAAAVRRTPVLMAQRGTGEVGWLTVRAEPDGTGEIYPDPLALGLLPMSRSFLDSCRIAQQTAWDAAGHAPEETSPDVCWRIESPLLARDAQACLEGGSHGAALGLALTQLWRGDLLDAGYALTATLAPDGAFGPVTGIVEKTLAAFARQEGTSRPAVRCLVVAPANLAEARGVAANLGLDPESAVEGVACLADILPRANGLLKQMQTLLRGEIAAIVQDAGERMGRAFADWPELAAFAVPIRVGRGLPDESARPERGGESERRTDEVAWQQVRTSLARAVVLGAPGNGKTMLLWQEAGRRCTEALHKLEQEPGQGLGLQFCLFLCAADVARALPERPAPDAIATTAADLAATRHGLNALAHAHVAASLLRGDCLLALDALDEVSVEFRDRLAAGLDALVHHAPQARLLLSSRRDGYARSALVAPENELEMLSFDAPQMEQFVRLWFRAVPQAGETLWKTIQARSRLHYLLRAPLLLRIACQTAENAARQGRALPTWNRSVDLYAACLDAMLARWAQRSPTPTPGQRDLFLPCAARVALETVRQPDDAGAKSSRLSQIIGAIQPDYPGRSLRDDLCGAGILVSLESERGDAALAFAHRTLGEYLAAWQLARQANASGWAAIQAEIDRSALSPDWQGVIPFLAGLLEFPVPLLKLLSDPSKDDLFRHRLALAARCLPEAIRDETGLL